MKTEKQNSPGRTQLCQLIQHMTITMMTTVDDKGVLVSRPMSPLLLDGDGSLWFFTDVRADKVKQIDGINLNFIDSARATYVSIYGRGEIHTERTYIDRLWTPFAKPWFPEGPDSKNLALLKFVPDSAEYWDSSHCKMVRILAVAASALLGKPVLMGEHEMIGELSEQARKTASG
ncbi:MAG: pyridoxamine 5'-phosphate oxidase family protein [Arenimonas sp.]